MRNILLLILTIFSLTADAQLANNDRSSANLMVERHRFRDISQVHMVQAQNHFKFLNFDEAIIEANHAVAANPNKAEAFLLRARIKMYMGMDTEAQADLQAAGRLNPYITQIYGLNGPDAQMELLAFEPDRIYGELELDHLLLYYDVYMDKQLAFVDEDEQTDIFEMSDMLDVLFEKSYPEAVEILKQYSDVGSLKAMAYDLMGLIYLRAEQMEKADFHFKEAIVIDPDYAMGWYNLAHLNRLQEQPEKALKNVERAIQLDENLVIAYFERAQIKKRLGKVKEAIEDYDRIIHQESQFYQQIYLNRGVALKTAGLYGAAIADMDKAIFAEPENPLSLKSRGNLYLVSGFYNKAIFDFTRAIELDSSLGEAYFNRGVAQLLNLDPFAACYDWTKALELGYKRASEKLSCFCMH
ncbi:MAG: tetratricopeptide repeat protein [Bacteroidota bacterium]